MRNIKPSNFDERVKIDLFIIEAFVAINSNVNAQKVIDKWDPRYLKYVDSSLIERLAQLCIQIRSLDKAKDFILLLEEDDPSKSALLNEIFDRYLLHNDLAAAEKIAYLIPDSRTKAKALRQLARDYQGSNGKKYTLSFFASWHNHKRVYSTAIAISAAASGLFLYHRLRKV